MIFLQDHEFLSMDFITQKYFCKNICLLLCKLKTITFASKRKERESSYYVMYEGKKYLLVIGIVQNYLFPFLQD